MGEMSRAPAILCREPQLRGHTSDDLHARAHPPNPPNPLARLVKIREQAAQHRDVATPMMIYSDLVIPTWHGA